MAITFLEPGTDWTNDLSLYAGSYAGGGGSVGSSAVQSHTGGRAVRMQAPSGGDSAGVLAPHGSVADAGTRVSFYWYAGTRGPNFVGFRDASDNYRFELNLCSDTIPGSGYLTSNFSFIKNLSTTFNAGQWYRISIAYVVTSTSNFTIKVWVDGVLDTTFTQADGTLAGIGTSYVSFECNHYGSNAIDVYVDDVYADDSNALTDPGDIIVARPTISGVSPSSFADAQTGVVASGANFSAAANEVWVSPVDDIDGETVVTASPFGGALGGTNPTTSTTITIPASLPVGCGLVVVFTSRDHTSGTGQPTVTDNNGGAAWTQEQFTTDRKAQLWTKRYEANLSGKTITISGAVGSLSAVLLVVTDVYATGSFIADFVQETNASGNETHAALTPTYAGSLLVFSVHNYANDNAVTSISAANFGAADASSEHLSTGGNDCATAMGLWVGRSTSSSGAITWAQTNGTTYSFAFCIRPRTPLGASIQQTVTAQSTTDATFTAVKNTLALGSAYLFVKNALALSNTSGFAVAITAPKGFPFRRLNRSAAMQSINTR